MPLTGHFYYFSLSLQFYWTRSITGYLPAGRQGAPNDKKPCIMYIIRSKVDGRLYKGITISIENRIIEHNSGKTKSTKAFRPWKLVYSEKYSEIQEARNRELFLKSGEGRELLKQILDP